MSDVFIQSGLRAPPKGAVWAAGGFIVACALVGGYQGFARSGHSPAVQTAGPIAPIVVSPGGAPVQIAEAKPIADAALIPVADKPTPKKAVKDDDDLAPSATDDAALQAVDANAAPVKAPAVVLPASPPPAPVAAQPTPADAPPF